MPLVFTEPPGVCFVVAAPMMILMFGGLRIRELRTITGGWPRTCPLFSAAVL